MTRMKEQQVEIVSKVNGTRAEAVVLHCPECDGVEFIALLVGSGRHMHLKCSSCNDMYCAHEGLCANQQPN